MTTVVAVLEEGRNKIRDLGWYRGETNGETSQHAPMPNMDPGDCHCLITSIIFADETDAAAKYIFAALGLRWSPNPSYHPIYEINDHQPIETGQQWAIGVMERAIELAKAAQS